MATKQQRRRKHSRKAQSHKDKERALMADTTYAEPLREYNAFLEHLKSHGYARDEFIRIPLNLIDLAAALITSMITGRELSLFGSKLNPKHQENNNRIDGQTQPQQSTTGSRPLDEETEAFYFIQRILKRTQLSCTTLILALIYIDRFKARISRTLKRRTRLDQGPDYAYITSTTSTSQSSSSLLSLPFRRKFDTLMDSTKSSPSIFSLHSPSASSDTSTDTSSSSSTNATQDTSNNNKPGHEPWSSITLFLVAVICADKYLFDATFSNAEWADFTKGQYTTQELNDLERRFLGHLQYKLYVSEPEFDGFLQYLEVILALKQVWGRGLIAFSYSDVRILTQNLLPAYAGRLHFRALHGDMMSIIWQVMSTISRAYLALIGTIMFAAASYSAVMELASFRGIAMTSSESMITSAGGFPLIRSAGTFLPLTTANANPCESSSSFWSSGHRKRPIDLCSDSLDGEDEDCARRRPVLDVFLAQSTVVQCVDCF
ncbi:Cyclin-dependent protein kinase [Linnemannia schmuckeri]|uniref:Cyclin-dependent protein kinase n=1 Tax=Linnemannia schmuckeri TaxID=64567 RepID=A0A9P5V8Y9_9FUNG|nr:Cyclin-dependent protein kinase [Linnemannia schmuckeri]